MGNCSSKTKDIDPPADKAKANESATTRSTTNNLVSSSEKGNNEGALGKDMQITEDDLKEQTYPSDKTTTSDIPSVVGSNMPPPSSETRATQPGLASNSSQAPATAVGSADHRALDGESEFYSAAEDEGDTIIDGRIPSGFNV